MLRYLDLVSKAMKRLALLVLLFLPLIFAPSTFAVDPYWTPEQFIGVLNLSIGSNSDLSPLIYNVGNPGTTSADEYTTDEDCLPSEPNCVCKTIGPDLICKKKAENVEVLFGLEIEETDFNPELDDQVFRATKIQNTPQHYFYNQGGKLPTLEYGTLNLLLSTSQKLSLQRHSAKWASDTKISVDQSGVFPIGGFPYKRSLTLSDNTTIEAWELWNNLPSYIRNGESGWTKQAVKDTNKYTTALRQFNPSPEELAETAYAHNEARVSVGGVGIPTVIDPGASTNWGSGDWLTGRQTVPYQWFASRGSAWSAKLYRDLTTSSKSISLQNEEIVKEYPLINLLEDTSTIPTSGSVEDYIDSLVESHEIANAPFQASSADATQDAESSSVIQTIFNDIAKLIDLQIENKTWNVLPPSAALANRLTSIKNSQTLPSGSQTNFATDKTIPAYSNKGVDIALGGGDQIYALQSTFSQKMSCTSTHYSTVDTDVRDYLDGVRESCAKPTGTAGNVCTGGPGSPIGGSCGLCNLDDPIDYMVSIGSPVIPPQMQAIIESAAETYQVPAGIILGIMFAEGGFEREACYGPWTDALVCQEEITNCRSCNVSSAGAVGPYQIIESYFPGVNGCNFEEATFTTAANLKAEADGNPVWDDTACGPYTYNQGFASTFTCSTWTSQDVATAARAHRGLCDENYLETAINFWLHYSCN